MLRGKYSTRFMSCVYDKHDYDSLISLLDFGHTVFSYINGNIIKCARNAHTIKKYTTHLKQSICYVKKITKFLFSLCFFTCA